MNLDLEKIERLLILAAAILDLLSKLIYFIQ